MGKNTIVGKCALCGKERKLTFEHVPPQKAFNSTSIVKYPFKESIKTMTGEAGRKPWDFSGLKGTTTQGGDGDYYLCEECNNNTGSWYISEYVMLSKIFAQILCTENTPVGQSCSFFVRNIRPLRVLKATMTMFCDINHECFGDTQLRDFLLNKESADFNSEKYSVYINMVKGPMRRVNRLSGMHMVTHGITLVSEIQAFPIGLTLFIDKPSSYNPIGICINQFANCGFNDCQNVEFSGMPILEINSLFPTDFRSKKDFIALENMSNLKTESE